MILHAIALVFAVGELVLTASARRTARSVAAIVASAAMVAAMADSGLIGPRILPAVAWTALLVVLALVLAVAGRVHETVRSRHGASPAAAPALGLIAMAFLPFLGDHVAMGSPVSTHEHSGTLLGIVMVGLVVGLIVASAVSALRSWRARTGLRSSVAARVCMLCSLTTMMAAVVR